MAERKTNTCYKAGDPGVPRLSPPTWNPIVLEVARLCNIDVNDSDANWQCAAAYASTPRLRSHLHGLGLLDAELFNNDAGGGKK